MHVCNAIENFHLFCMKIIPPLSLKNWWIIICTLFILYVSVSLVSFTMVCICIKLTVFYFKIDVSSSSVKILFLLKIYTSCRFHCFRPILYFLMNLKQYSIPCFRHFSDVTIIDLCTEVMVLQLKEQWIDKS